MVEGQEWYIPSSGRTYKRVNDGVSELWIDITGTGTKPAIDQSEEFTVGTASNNYDGVSLNTFPMANGYIPGTVTVFRNGFALALDDFDMTDGTNVVLVNDASIADIIFVQAFSTFTVTDGEYAMKAQDIDTSTVYADNTAQQTYKMYVDNEDIILERIT